MCLDSQDVPEVLKQTILEEPWTALCPIGLLDVSCMRLTSLPGTRKCSTDSQRTESDLFSVERERVLNSPDKGALQRQCGGVTVTYKRNHWN